MLYSYYSIPVSNQYRQIYRIPHFDNSPTPRYREPTRMKESITNNVYELRSRAAVTQEVLAEHLGVSRQTIIAIEKGNYTPSIALALKIAQFFKVPVEKIFSIHYEK